MKVLFLAGLALLAVVSAGVFFVGLKTGPTPVPAEIVAKYTAWKSTFRKLYATPAEDGFRLRVFYDQTMFIDKTNQDYEAQVASAGEKLSGPMFAMNHFGDLTDEEFKARYTGAKVSYDVEPSEPSTAKVEASAEKSLQQASYPVYVRNQGSCGSCWAHGAVATLEKHYWDLYKTRMSFSQQQLVDCDKTSTGCEGGWDHNALNYVKTKGIAQLAHYPYTMSVGTCRDASVTTVKIPIKNVNYQWFLNTAAASWINAGKHGSGLVYSTGKFRYLSSTDDIFDASKSGECGQQMNHVITLMQADAAGTYFRILNSWGTTWASGGTKLVKPCASNNLFGTYSTFSFVE